MTSATKKPQVQQLWTASDSSILELDAAYTRLKAAAKKSLNRYWDDPVAFAYDCINWPEGQSLTPYQEEVLSELPMKRRVAQRGPHGLGKSTTHALAILWFAFTRDAAAVDWKCPTTAGGWHQLEQYLWPEVHKWANRLNWERIGRDPFKNGELLRLNLKLNYGTAFAVASNVPARIEGAHADSMLFIFDEAKIIPTATFDAAEGAFSGTGESMAFASSTPGEPVGRFYDICVQRPGLDAWWPRHITLDESIAAGRIDPDWAKQSALLWGPESALYANRVLGEFHSDDESAVIPLAWIEAAIQRWKDHQFASTLHPEHRDFRPVGMVDRVGVDVAVGGEDRTVLTLWAQDRLDEIRDYHHLETTETSSKVAGVLIANPGATAIVDADGVGVGVYHELKNDDRNVEPFHASAGTEKRDSSGELGFINVRAAAWWNLREQLDPRLGATVELPEHDLLLGDLTAPKWKDAGKSKIQVESKDDIKKRLGRSPDFGDSAMMARWSDIKRRRSRMTFAGRA